MRGANPVPLLTISGSPPGTAYIGEAYTFAPVLEGGKDPLACSLEGDLPPGMDFDPVTGAITGVPI